MYPNINGKITCCSCSLAPLTETIFTKGFANHPIFNDQPDACDKCHGAGCEECMMSDDFNFSNVDDALKHLRDHLANGDRVPYRAIKRLEQERKI
jgi:hypothetical protein